MDYIKILAITLGILGIIISNDITAKMWALAYTIGVFNWN